MKRLLVWNGNSGKASLQGELLDLLGGPGAIDRVELGGADERLADRIAVAVEGGCQTVIAAGGDGTVNAVVNAIMHLAAEQRPSLAIIPLGTANDFAGTLGISDVLSEAVALLDAQQTVPIDVVCLHSSAPNRYYANIAAGGNSVRVSEEMTDEIKARWGAYCYLRGAVEVLADLDSYIITAQMDEQRLDRLGAWAVLVANGRTNAGRIMVAPNASPVDGLLDVIIIRDGSVLDIVDIVSHALLDSYLESDQVIYCQATRLKLHSVPGMRFSIDGEVIDEEPIEFQVIPAAIPMYVGGEFLESHREQLNKVRWQTSTR